MSARKRKRYLDTRACWLARLHIAYSMPGWAFASKPDDLDELFASCETVLAELDRQILEMHGRTA